MTGAGTPWQPPTPAVSSPPGSPVPVPGSSAVPAAAQPTVSPYAPPPGPGVQPPFVAPPTDGSRQRRWLAIGLASAAALLCCVGGLFGLGALVVLGNQTVQDEATGVVTDYLTAVRDEEYVDAWALLCESEQDRTPLSDLARSYQDGPKLAAFEVNDLDTSRGLVVSATLHYENGDRDDVRFRLEQETSTGRFKVCGQES